MKRGAALFFCLLFGCFHETVQLLPEGATGSDAALAGQGVGSARGGQCGGSSYHAANTALEILILVDTSLSAILPSFECVLGVATCRASWDVTVSELSLFVADPRSVGISLALKYLTNSCEPRDYETPDVPMGQLPEHGLQITQSLAATLPITGTPTRPALEGVLAYARRRSQAPDYNARLIVVLLADDGPDQADCRNNDLAAVVQVAASGVASTPPIPTYAFATTRTRALDDVARAGGTERSINADLAQAGVLSAALNNLRDHELAGLPCEYMLPEAYSERVRNPKLVNLRRDGAPLGRVRDASDCSDAQGGWYYDDADKPTRILTCPSTCSALKQGGSVDIQLDCPTVILY